MTTEPTNATTETTQPPAPTTPKPDLHPKNTYTFNASDHHSKCVRLQAEIEFTIPYPNQAKVKQHFWGRLFKTNDVVN